MTLVLISKQICLRLLMGHVTVLVKIVCPMCACKKMGNTKGKVFEGNTRGDVFEVT